MAMKLSEIFRRGALAACCVAGPLLFGLISIYYTDLFLIPAQLAIPLTYHQAKPFDANAAQTDAARNKEDRDARSSAAAVPPAAAPPLPPVSSSATGVEPPAHAPVAKQALPQHDSEALVFWTVGQQYRGRITYAVSSAFLYLISAAVFLFGMTVFQQRCGWFATIAMMAFFAALAKICSSAEFTPPGRPLLLENLLTKADEFFPYVEPLKVSDGAGNAASHLVKFNTFVSLWSIGTLLAALAILSIREDKRQLSRDVLEDRLRWLRMGLGLGSTFLVVGVLAQKALMAWPLALIDKDQAAGLQPLADALTLQLGAQGTMGLIAAFGPAIAAWYLDVLALRRKTHSVGGVAKQKSPAQPSIESRIEETLEYASISPAEELHLRVTELRQEAPPAAGAAKQAPPPQQSVDRPDDESSLVFAPISTIAGLLAVLAPILASPFVDALKSIFQVFVKNSP